MAVTLICGEAFGSGDTDRFERMVASLRFTAESVVSTDGTAAARVAAVALGPPGQGGPEPAVPQRARQALFLCDRASATRPAEAARADLTPEAMGALRALSLPRSFQDEIAFAFWDAEAEMLTLGRDRIGVRPLFHARAGDGAVLFASHPAALIAGGIPDEPLECAVVAGLARLQLRGDERTVFPRISRVRPGHLVRFDRRSTEARRYWRLAGAIDPAITPEEAEAGLRRRLEAAVAARIPGTGRVATHLSGGLDSAAIATLAARRAGGRVTGIAFATPETRAPLGAPDETPFASAVAQRAGIALRRAPGDHFAAAIDGELDPCLAVSAARNDPEQGFLSVAVAEGASVVLCGFGGDEAASYNGTGAEIDDLTRLRLGAIAARARAAGRSPVSTLGAELADLALPPRLGEALRAVTRRPARAGAEFDRYVLPRWHDPHVFPSRWSSAAHRRDLLETGIFLHRLEWQALRAAEHGLSYAYPMLDPELLAFATALPAAYFHEGRMRRTLFRRVARDLLPESVVANPRKLMPDATGLVALAERRGVLAATLERIADHPEVRAVFDVDAFRQALARLPDPATAAARVRAAAAEGRQLAAPELDILPPFRMARFAARDGLRPPLGA